MRMRSLLIIFLSLLQGCATSPTLDKERAASLTHIHIVPIESPFFANWCVWCTDFKGEIIHNKYRRTRFNDGLKVMFDAGFEAAKKTEHYLKTEYNYSTTISTKTTTLPGLESWKKFSSNLKFPPPVSDEEAWEKYNSTSEVAPHSRMDEFTKYVQLWWALKDKWYLEDTSSSVYLEQPDSDTVLEITTYSYERNKNPQFSTEIFIKLVDTQSRLVLARNYCYGRFGWGMFPRSLNASSKEAFFKNIEKAIPDCIEDLGLHKK